MPNLIVAQNSLMAIQIASSLGGILTKKRRIDREALPAAITNIEKNIQNGAKNLKTKLNGKTTYVTWISASPVTTAPLRGEPKIYQYKIHKLDEETLQNIKDERYLNENRKIDNLYFALLDTEESELAKNVIEKSVRAENTYSVSIVHLSAEEITKAFKRATLLNADTKVAEFVQRDILITNVRKQIEERTKGTVSINHYELAALSILKKRSGIVKAQKVRHQIQAKAQIHGTPCTMQGHLFHTLEEAEKMIAEFPQTIILDGEYASGYCEGFLTTAELIRHPVTKEWNLEKALQSLYAKGLISDPYTQTPFISSSMSVAEMEEIIDTCIEWTTEETMPRKDAVEAVKKTRRDRLRKTAIIPYRTSGDQFMRMTKEEKKLYELIVRLTEEKFHANSMNSFRFLAGKYPLYAVFNLDRIRDTMKVNEHLGAMYTVVTEKKEKRFGEMKLEELFIEMQRSGIGEPDTYLKTSKSLVEKNLVSVNSSGEAVITEYGNEVFSQLPAGKDFLTLCAKWEEELHTEVFAEWPVRTVEELKKQLDKDLSNFIKAGGKVKAVSQEPAENADEKTANQDTEKSIPAQENAHTKITEREQEEKSYNKMMCPLCGESAVKETEEEFLCEHCSFKIAKTPNIDGYETRFTEADLTKLAASGRTGVKSFRDKEGTVAGYLVIENGKLDITNESQISCPVCGKPLFIYDWGFSCEGCSFSMPFIIAGNKIDMKEYQKVLAGKETNVIDGFKDKDGNTFSAIIHISGGKVTLKKS